MIQPPHRYRLRPDLGLDLLDDTGQPVGALAVDDALAILYRCDDPGQPSGAVECHGPVADVLATWRKMWPALSIGTMAGGPEVNAQLRLAQYAVARLDRATVALINDVLSQKAKPDTLDAALRHCRVDRGTDADHDPSGPGAPR